MKSSETQETPDQSPQGSPHDPAPPPDQAESSASGAQTITIRAIARLLMVLSVLLGLGWVVWSTWSALLPFQIGIILAYLILPIVNRLSQYIPRWTAIICVYLAGLLLAVGAMLLIVPQLVSQAIDALDALPTISDIQDQAEQLLQAVETFRQVVPEEVRETIDGAVAQTVDTMRNNLVAYAQDVGALLVNSSIGLINTVTFVLGFVIEIRAVETTPFQRQWRKPRSSFRVW